MKEIKFIYIRLIGYCLTALYAGSLAFYLQDFSSKAVFAIPMRPMIIAIFLAVLLVGALAVICFREWGRTLLVWANLGMGIFLLFPYMRHFEELIPFAFIIMNMIIIFFFSQTQIKVYFRHIDIKKRNGATWQSVLVVDDDQAFLKIIRPILMTHGFSVLTANSGDEGLRVAKAQKPELIILDVILPGLRGREVCKKLKEDPLTRDIQVIFVTVKDSKDDIEAEMQVGAAAHLTKPIEIKKFIKTVQGLLESRATCVVNPKG